MVVQRITRGDASGHGSAAGIECSICQATAAVLLVCGGVCGGGLTEQLAQQHIGVFVANAGAAMACLLERLKLKQAVNHQVLHQRLKSKIVCVCCFWQ